MNELTPIEEGILTCARTDGMVPFPQGAARVIEQSFKVLESLAQRGYVHYERNKNWYRAYWLTEKGRRLARAIRAVHRQCLPATARHASG